MGISAGGEARGEAKGEAKGKDGTREPDQGLGSSEEKR
jgi:hypothetical protein